jgi:hypothetical protein
VSPPASMTISTLSPFMAAAFARWTPPRRWRPGHPSYVDLARTAPLDLCRKAG